MSYLEFIKVDYDPNNLLYEVHNLNLRSYVGGGEGCETAGWAGAGLATDVT